VATSHRASRLRPPLPKAPDRQCLSIAKSPWAHLTGGSSVALGRGGRQDGQTSGEISLARAYLRVEN
jgi:hypothetical protein